MIPASGGAAVTIRYAGTDKLRPRIQIYRSSARGTLHLVKTYAATTSSGTSVWNGTLRDQRPAPAGHVSGRDEADRHHLQTGPLAGDAAILRPARPRAPA